MPYGSEKQPSQIKCVAKVNTSLLVALCLSVLLPEAEQSLVLPPQSPLVNPSVYNHIVAVPLNNTSQ